MIYDTTNKKRTSWRWRDAHQMDAKEVEINQHLRVRISLNRLSATRTRPSYTLFFSDRDESFHVNLANTTSSSSAAIRAPVLSKLGVLYTEKLAFESETAFEHTAGENQTDYRKGLTASATVFSNSVFNYCLSK